MNAIVFDTFTNSYDITYVLSGINLQYFDSKIEAAHHNALSEKYKFFPQFNLGYGKQRIDGVGGFYSFEIGVSMPLWFLPQLGKVQEAELSTEIDRQEYYLQKSELISQFTRKKEEYDNIIQTLIFYRDEALELAEEVIETARNQYETGDIGYTEMIQNLEQAINIKQDFLYNLYTYFQIRNELDLLTSKNEGR
jgi:cobalt-zinc-cadmium resistance protein CzcA